MKRCNLTSPQPPASPRQSPESTVRQRRIRPVLYGLPSSQEENICSWMSGSNQTLVEEDRFFEKKLHLGGQMAILACKLAKVIGKDTSPSPSPSPPSSRGTLSSVDTHTPRELRAIPFLGSPDGSRFTPTPPPETSTRRKSQIPVRVRGPALPPFTPAPPPKEETRRTSRVLRKRGEAGKFMPLHEDDFLYWISTRKRLT